MDLTVIVLAVPFILLLVVWTGTITLRGSIAVYNFLCGNEEPLEVPSSLKAAVIVIAQRSAFLLIDYPLIIMWPANDWTPDSSEIAAMAILLTLIDVAIAKTILTRLLPTTERKAVMIVLIEIITTIVLAVVVYGSLYILYTLISWLLTLSRAFES